MKTVINKVSNFTTIHNDILNDVNLSFKAKGILIYMLSKPADWEYNIRGDISKRSTDKEASVYSGVQELIEHGYVSRIKHRDGTVDYYIFESKEDNNITDYMSAKPTEMPDRENPDQGKPDLGKPDLDNRDVLIRKNTTKERNIVILNNNKELASAFKDFELMRKKIKKPLTERAKKMALDKLEKLSGGNEELAIEILQQSIFKCWQDLYPLKDDGGTVEGKKDILTPEGLQKNIDKWGLSE